MKKRHQRSVTIKGQTNKSSMYSHAKKSRCLLNINQHVYQERPANWFQMKKRAKQRLRTISNGRIMLVTDPRYPQMYYGHHKRHWLLDSETGHTFRASVREVAILGAMKINPFTNKPIDLEHYGTLEAIQTHVHCLSFGNIEFKSDNELRGVDDYYQMACLIHQCRFDIKFSDFLADPTGACMYCNFSKC